MITELLGVISSLKVSRLRYCNKKNNFPMEPLSHTRGQEVRIQESGLKVALDRDFFRLFIANPQILRI